MNKIKFIKKPKLKNPFLICAWPGMGQVAYKAAVYLVDKLKAEGFAEIQSEDFFYSTGSTIKEGLIDLTQTAQNRFYYWKNKNGKNDLIIFISNAQPDLSRAQDYSKLIFNLASEYKIKTAICFAAMPQPIEHQQPPGIWFASTTKELNASLKKYNFHLLSEGQISGMNGLFLKLAKGRGINGFCLLGEIPLYTIHIENPKASSAVLAALGRILNINIDLNPLIEETHILENEINKLFEYLKISTPAGPIQEEEIEKIKKSLAQLTKLPRSVKQRIEELFIQAKTDITKANELKAELDSWNVYKEYEDKFLDLFKKKKEKNN